MKIVYTETVPTQTIQTPFGPSTISSYPGAQKEIDIDDATVAAIASKLVPGAAPTKLTPAELATQYSKNDLLQAALLSTT